MMESVCISSLLFYESPPDILLNYCTGHFLLLIILLLIIIFYLSGLSGPENRNMTHVPIFVFYISRMSTFQKYKCSYFHVIK
jgi:hypothetical protein